MNTFYHKMSILDMLTGNWWTIIAAVFIVVAIVIAVNQYGIRNSRLVKNFGDTPYFLLGAAAALTISVLLVVESHAGIIQLLDNALRGNESPLMSGLLLGPTAMVFGGMFGFALIILSEAIATFRKRSLIKKLRRISEQRRKAQAQAKRHRVNHTNRVSSGYGMRRC